MGLQITKSRSPNSDKFWGNSNIVKGNHGNLLTDPLHPRMSNMDNWTAVDLYKKIYLYDQHFCRCYPL